MAKITMANPIVEMDGDEMARILWAQIKEELLLPFLELKTEYYDLGLMNRDKTGDQVTVDAGKAVKKHRVGVKCATITANDMRAEEYRLTKVWASPNATIRAILDGTVFREPILVKLIKPAVRTWVKPITIARHAYGDIYKAVEYRAPGAGKAELIFTPKNGEPVRQTVYDFEEPGVLQAVHNRDGSITSFAHACFRYALDKKQDLWFASKDTISKQYDQRFRAIFQTLFETEYRALFKAAGIGYYYTLIDDAVARAIRSEGGFVWACKNYDGDVMSDMVSAAFGSLAMMTSVLVSPDGSFEYEAAHGTITRHYYRYLNGEETSTNPLAMIFAWSGALRKRGGLDRAPALAAFADALETASLEAVESGLMTADLAGLCEGIQPKPLNTAGFIQAVRRILEEPVLKQ
ncbi:MAG: NADP-dependent isocitrate dehydrogenase [Treponema sp.]|jgi:isocitrate dehydrogenase|nr:NADP-dependent isocitrate dehydrogenase [Treponema sp.]